MFSSRLCVFCRLVIPNSPRIIIRYCGKTVRSAAAASNQSKKSNDDVSSKPSANTAEMPLRKTQLLDKVPPLAKENILTIPNALCLSRIALSPLLGYFVINGDYVFGMAIFAYAAITDLVDGWIARSFPGQQSVLGSALDPLADKILISVLVLSLTYVGLIPLPLTALVVGRDVGLITSGFVMRFISLDPPRTLSRYFDITAPTVKVKPRWISKINTGLQLGMVACSLAAPVFGYIDHPALYALWYGTACTTVASGLTYLFAKDSYEVIRKRKRDKGER